MPHQPVFIDPSSGKPWVAWFASGTPADYKSQWKIEGGKISHSIKDPNITHFFSLKKHEMRIRRLLDTTQTILYHPSWIKDSVSVHFAKPLGHYVLEDHSFVDEDAEENPRRKTNHYPRFRSPERLLSSADESCTTLQRTGPRTSPIRTRRLDNRSYVDLTIEEEPFDVVSCSTTSRARTVVRTSKRRKDDNESLGDVHQGGIHSLATHEEAPFRNMPERNGHPVTSSLTPESPSEISHQPSNLPSETVPPVNRTRRKMKRKANDDDFFEPPPPEMIDIEDDFFAKTGTYTGDGLLERAIDLSARLIEGDPRYRAVTKKAAI